MEFFGHIFDKNSIHIKEEYKQVVAEWPALADKADLDQFLGLVNYFKNWIPDYAKICVPLNALRKKNAPGLWTEQHSAAVQKLKDTLLSSSVLHYFNAELKTVMHSNSSAFVIGGWIRQLGEAGQEHLILFWSCKMLDRETRYSMYEQELLALIKIC